MAQTAYNAVVEIIVVNDGSTDGSAALLSGLEGEIDKLVVLNTTGTGPSVARNLAIHRAQGELIAILDGDDYWAVNKIEQQLPAFALGDSVALVYGDYVDFSGTDTSNAQLVSVRRFGLVTADVLAEYFVHDGPVIPSTMIVRRTVLHQVGLFDVDMRLGEDTDICLKIAERWKFAYVPGALTFKRRHDSNLTRRLDALLPVAKLLTSRFAMRNPRLIPLTGQRMARRYARAGNDCAQHGEQAKAIRFLFKAIQSDPFFWRPYVYLAFALVPYRLSAPLRHLAKALFHRRRISTKADSVL